MDVENEKRVEVDLQIYGLGAGSVPKNEVQVLWSSLSLVRVSCSTLKLFKIKVTVLTSLSHRNKCRYSV